MKGKFNNHFIKRRNIIFEREKSNKRKQQPVETSDIITELYALAEYCEYGALREEMIRDRLVVGLLDATLSEKLQSDPDLALEKAIAKVCNAETVKSQEALVRGEDASNMDSPHWDNWKGKTETRTKDLKGGKKILQQGRRKRKGCKGFGLCIIWPSNS